MEDALLEAGFRIQIARAPDGYLIRLFEPETRDQIAALRTFDDGGVQLDSYRDSGEAFRILKRLGLDKLIEERSAPRTVPGMAAGRVPYSPEASRAKYYLRNLPNWKRGDPTTDYPGRFIVYVNGKHVDDFTDQADAIRAAKKIWDDPATVRLKPPPWREHEGPLEPEVSVCWFASDDDPRVGSFWFTGFYQLGKIDHFGRFVGS